ncbi:hypothetical protein RM543_13865 [Roseicyclus sp. F158]|uniref:Secreted protein n=1 Tax=Tropicimonas omnivorans TaxID=3075590 RepID=A0ABU3DJR1_9RHOB|nr:hypothetical protein [Roseicyclus sp. F158]MDT0683774.1 hypothetical protein [Roseicyclus sp. F158]
MAPVTSHIPRRGGLLAAALVSAALITPAFAQVVDGAPGIVCTTTACANSPPEAGEILRDHQSRSDATQQILDRSRERVLQSGPAQNDIRPGPLTFDSIHVGDQLPSTRYTILDGLERRGLRAPDDGRVWAEYQGQTILIERNSGRVMRLLEEAEQELPTCRCERDRLDPEPCPCAQP